MRVVGSVLFACGIAGLAASAPTDTYIRGKVTGPDGNPVKNVVVTAEVCTTQDADCAFFSALTDSVGEYTIYLTTDLRGNSVSVQAKDDSGVVADALTPPARELTIEDSLTAVDFQFTRETRVLALIRVVDRNNLPADSSVTMKIENDAGSVQVSTDTAGTCTALVVPGLWSAKVDDPDYLGPRISFTVADSGTTEVTYKVYLADDSITGTISGAQGFDFPSSMTIIAEGFVAQDTAQIMGSAAINSDGTYILKVFSGVSKYDVRAQLNESVREDYALTPSEYLSKAPGDTGVSFEVLAADAGVFCNVDIRLEGLVGIEITLIDEANNRRFHASADLPNPDITIGVPSGTYTAILTVCYGNKSSCEYDTTRSVPLSSGQVTFFVNDDGMTVPITKAAAPRNQNELGSGLKSIIAVPGTVTLQFMAPAKGKATLELFDLKGSRAAVLFSRDVDPGAHQVRIAGRDLADGSYLARLRIQGNRPYDASMVVIKTR